ncbi:MAG: hypothetical protein KDA70_17275, partial [Planctomycetaceae bacterium]|nr:hypothetical protein [Planctomycetaceae bacterium]
EIEAEVVEEAAPAGSSITSQKWFIPAVAGGGIGLLLIVLVVMFVLPGGEPEKPAPVKPAPVVQKPVEVESLPEEIKVGPNETYKTIAAVLKDIQIVYGKTFGADSKHYTVKVTADQELKERIVIDNSNLNYPKGISIVAESGKPVILAPDGPEPVIQLQAIEGLTIDGFLIKAQGKKTAIQLSGYLVGTQLKNLKINDFQKSGVSATSVSGLSNEPFQMENLNLKAANPAAVGLDFTGDTNSDIRLTKVRCLNAMQIGLQFASSVRETQVKESIFSETVTGIRFDCQGAEVSHLKLTNNTFFIVNSGIVFTAMPNASSEVIQISRNLFATIEGPPAKVEQNNDAKFWAKALTASENDSSRAAPSPLPADELDLFKNKGKQGDANFNNFVSTTPGDEKFLAPASDNPAAKAAGSPGGMKPFIGAVAP